MESWIESKVGEKGEWSKSACEMTKRMKKGRKKRRMRRRTQSPKKRSSFMMPVSPCTKSKSKSKSKHGKAKEEKRRLRHYYAPPPPPPLLHNRQAASAAPHIAALLPNTRSPFREFLVHNISGYSFLQSKWSHPSLPFLPPLHFSSNTRHFPFLLIFFLFFFFYFLWIMESKMLSYIKISFWFILILVFTWNIVKINLQIIQFIYIV